MPCPRSPDLSWAVFFTDTVGWRWAFWMNVPLSALAVLVAATTLPTTRRSYEKGSFDVRGTLALAAALSTLTFAISLGGSTLPWNSPIILGLLAGTAIAAIAFSRAETHAVQPIMSPSLLESRNFLVCATGGFITMFVMMGTLTYLPTYYQVVDQMSAMGAGYMELPMNIAWFVASLISGALVARRGRYKRLMVVGFVLLVVGVLTLCGITLETPVLLIAAVLSLVGFGIGLTFEILVLIVQNEFPASDVGMSTAATNLVREMGTTLGTAVAGALFTSRLADTLSQGLASVGGVGMLVNANALTPAIVRSLPDAVRETVRLAYNDALVPVFWVMAALSACGLACMLLLRERPLAE